jgi:hypothetical protein
VLAFTIRENISQGLSRSEVNDAIRRTWFIVGSDYHRAFMAKHFTHAGAREYGYAPRKGERGAPGSKGFRRSYTGRKLRQKGHTLPLVWSGESRTLARVRDVRATSKGCRIVIHANKLNFRNPKSEINMRDEVTRVSDMEARVVMRDFAHTLGKLLNEGVDRRMRTLRIA